MTENSSYITPEIRVIKLDSNSILCQSPGAASPSTASFYYGDDDSEEI